MCLWPLKMTRNIKINWWLVDLSSILAGRVRSIVPSSSARTVHIHPFLRVSHLPVGRSPPLPLRLSGRETRKLPELISGQKTGLWPPFGLSYPLGSARFAQPLSPRPRPNPGCSKLQPLSKLFVRAGGEFAFCSRGRRFHAVAEEEGSFIFEMQPDTDGIVPESITTLRSAPLARLEISDCTRALLIIVLIKGCCAAARARACVFGFRERIVRLSRRGWKREGTIGKMNAREKRIFISQQVPYFFRLLTAIASWQQALRVIFFRGATKFTL